MKLRMTVLSFLVLASPTLGQQQGPFGFHAGMREAEAIRIADASGAQHLLEHRGVFDILVVHKPRHSSPNFHKFLLTFTRGKGLVKIMAIDDDSDRGGGYYRSKFGEVKTALVAKYGPPKDNISYGRGALDVNDTHFSCFWVGPPNQERVQGIMLKGEITSPEKGYVTLSYEFPGFAEASSENERHQKSEY